jgi:hypothetical protein
VLAINAIRAIAQLQFRASQTWGPSIVQPGL